MLPRITLIRIPQKYCTSEPQRNWKRDWILSFSSFSWHQKRIMGRKYLPSAAFWRRFNCVFKFTVDRARRLFYRLLGSPAAASCLFSCLSCNCDCSLGTPCVCELLPCRQIFCVLAIKPPRETQLRNTENKSLAPIHIIRNK